MYLLCNYTADPTAAFKLWFLSFETFQTTPGFPSQNSNKRKNLGGKK